MNVCTGKMEEKFFSILPVLNLTVVRELQICVLAHALLLLRWSDLKQPCG